MRQLPMKSASNSLKKKMFSDNIDTQKEKLQTELMLTLRIRKKCRYWEKGKTHTRRKLVALKSGCCPYAFRHRQGSRQSFSTAGCRGKEDAINTGV